METPDKRAFLVFLLAVLNSMLILTLFSTALGCGGKAGSGRGPADDGGAGNFVNKDPDITGTIERIAVFTASQEQVPPPPGHGERSVGILEIKAHPAHPSAYQAASVKVTGETEMVREKSREKLHFADLEKGMLVKVWFQGPVAESWPVQATAGKIAVVE